MMLPTIELTGLLRLVSYTRIRSEGVISFMAVIRIIFRSGDRDSKWRYGRVCWCKHAYTRTMKVELVRHGVEFVSYRVGLVRWLSLLATELSLLGIGLLGLEPPQGLDSQEETN